MSHLADRLRSLSAAWLSVFVYFALPWPVHAHLALIREEWESAGVVESGDHLGTSLAVGDFNGDGFDDLAMGAPDDDNGVLSARLGFVIINYGSEHGLTHVGAQSLEDNTPGGRFGFALAAGDFDNDGFDDLAVGLPFAEPDGGSDSGEVRVYPGSASGLSNFWVPFDQSDVVGAASESGDLLGWSVAAGKFNDDAYDDLVAGAPGEDGGAGAVFYRFGGQFFFANSGSGGYLKHGDLGGLPIPADSLGYSLASGDLVSTTQDDLVIGVPYADITTTDAGQIYVVPGASTGFETAAAFKRSCWSLGLTPTAEGHFGWSLAIGDFWDTSGPSDLAIGEPGHEFNAMARVGRVVVTHVATALQGADSVVVILQDLAGNALVEANDEFGFALAAGDWKGDGDDELVVGTPNETQPSAPQSGLVQVFGGSAFPTGTQRFDGARANDVTGAFFELGRAVAFGQFDETNRASVAAGAPGADFRAWEDVGDSLGIVEHDAAGQVHIIASWRQPFDTNARSAVAKNCQDELVFSIRPFDPSEMASTTKIMTVWLAAEDITNGLINPDTLYIAKAWTDSCFGGSAAEPPLLNTEPIRLIDLMRLAMMHSAGDACLAIADLLSGPGEDFVDTCNPTDLLFPSFIQRMNDKANSIGMQNTLFTNPHGTGVHTFLGPGVHHSTAFDMAILGREAMQNAVFASVVRPEGWLMTRTMFIPDVGVVEIDFDYGNSYVRAIDSRLRTKLGPPDGLTTRGTGAKRGRNGDANNTGVATANNSAFLPDPMVVAASLGTGIQDKLADGDGTTRTNRNVDMLFLALSRCGGGITFPPPADGGEPAVPIVRLESIPADQDSNVGVGVEFDEPGEDLFVELYRRDVADAAADFDLLVHRKSRIELPPGGRATFGVVPYDAHLGFEILNLGERITLDMTLSHPAGTTSVTLGAYEEHVVNAHASLGASDFTMTLLNTSSTDTAQIDVEELGYRYGVSLGGGTGSGMGTLLKRDALEYLNEQMSVMTFGKDPTPGNTLTMLVRTGDVPVSVGTITPPNANAIPTVLRQTRGFPNPFNPEVTIEYELGVAADLSLMVFDVAGRRVRVLLKSGRKTVGRHQIVWDGRDDAGRRVASGVYLYRVQAGPEQLTNHIVLVK